jgi:hypothetical protein
MLLKHEFMGRETELRELRALQTLLNASLVILEGRRRVGESRLVEEFAAGQKFSRFIGLAPTPGTDAQMTFSSARSEPRPAITVTISTTWLPLGFSRATTLGG